MGLRSEPVALALASRWEASYACISDSDSNRLGTIDVERAGFGAPTCEPAKLNFPKETNDAR